MIRGATLLHAMRAALRDTNISPETDVFPHVAEYSERLSFPCALSGPFDKLYFCPALSIAGSL